MRRAVPSYRRRRRLVRKVSTETGANYQGLWWNAPAWSESGWGINFAHQGSDIFATWFTYGADGSPLWQSATAVKKCQASLRSAFPHHWSGVQRGAISVSERDPGRGGNIGAELR